MGFALHFKRLRKLTSKSSSKNLSKFLWGWKWKTYTHTDGMVLAKVANMDLDVYYMVPPLAKMGSNQAPWGDNGTLSRKGDVDNASRGHSLVIWKVVCAWKKLFTRLRSYAFLFGLAGIWKSVDLAPNLVILWPVWRSPAPDGHDPLSVFHTLHRWRCHQYEEFLERYPKNKEFMRR
jgi:hypothetical protein